MVTADYFPPTRTPDTGLPPLPGIGRHGRHAFHDAGDRIVCRRATLRERIQRVGSGAGQRLSSRLGSGVVLTHHIMITL
jgi:hypothetical protein